MPLQVGKYNPRGTCIPGWESVTELTRYASLCSRAYARRGGL